jgi:cell division protein FtsX
MRYKKRIAIILFMVSLVLFGLQAGIWARSSSHARSETDQQNIVIKHPPSEAAGIVALVLLLGAMVVAATPQHPH